jgi:hypothetical protein
MPPAHASGAPNVVGRLARKTAGRVTAGTSGTHLIREASAQPAYTDGLRLNVFHVAGGRRIPIGMRSDRPRGVLGFATCATSHPQLDETSGPTKPRQ